MEETGKACAVFLEVLVGAKVLMEFVEVEVVDTGGSASVGRHIAAGKLAHMGKKLRARVGSASSENNCNTDDFEPARFGVVGASIGRILEAYFERARGGENWRGLQPTAEGLEPWTKRSRLRMKCTTIM